MQHTITHAEHSETYFAGYEIGKNKISSCGFEATRDFFNSEYPVGYKPKSLQEWYFQKGFLQALCEALS